MLTEKKALEILKKYSLGEQFFAHCVAVSKKATSIAKQIKKNGYDVDVELVKIAGLLHDIGKNKIAGLDHGSETGRMLRNIGCCEKVARIAELHCFPGIPMKKLPLEAKILVYADSITLHSSYVTMEKRFEDTIERRNAKGLSKDAKLIKTFYLESKDLEKEILKYVSHVHYTE